MADILTPPVKAASMIMEGSPMETLNIDLPDSLKDFVLSQTAEGGYRCVSEYVGELIRAEQNRRGRQSLEEAVLKGLSSGQSTPMTPEDWQDIRREVRERHAKRQHG
jgi:antitoxin ParD1/3/4